MASPFHYFRKHQKALMAVAAVACMLIFVVGDALSGRGGGGGRGTNTTVVTWDGGSLSERQLQSLTEQRYIVSEFLTQLFVLGYDQDNPEPVELPDFRIPRDMRQDVLQSHVINTYILADLAEEAGMTVTDNIINDYIKKIGHSRVGQEQIVQIFSSLGRDPGSVENLIFENLRRLLLAYYYRTTYLDAGRVVMPYDRWEDWRQINDKIALNAAVLPVENYLDDVEAPSEAELSSLYNELKDNPSNLMADAGGRAMPSPDAGFTTPRKVKLHYLKGSLVDWRDKLRDEVTEEAIQEFYETNKQVLYLLPEGEDQAADDSSDAPPAAETPAEETAAEETPAKEAEEEMPAEPSGEEPAASDSPADDEQPSSDQGEEPAEEQTEESEAVEEIDVQQPQEETPDSSPADPAEEAEEDAEPAEEGDESGVEEQPADETDDSVEEVEAEEEEEEETPRDESAPSSDEAAVEEITEETTEETSSPAAEGQAEPASDADETPAAETADASPAAPSDESDADATPEGDDASSDDRYANQKYRPLEEVRDEVVDMLATEMAAEKLRSQMEAAYADLRSTYGRYGAAVAMAEDEETTPPEAPQRLVDLQPVAEQYELVYEKSPLMTQRELAAESIVGLSRSVEATGRVAPAVYQLVFDEDLGLYEPILTNENPASDWQGDWYLVLKVEDQPSGTPELEEVRDQVVETWKRRQAAAKAMNEAAKLADEFVAAEQGFEEFFESRDIEVVTTDLFSRKEFPNGPGQNEAPLLTTGFGLENVGAEFLEDVFALEGDKAKALLNFDNSIAYVVQIRNRERTEEELRELFLREANAWPGMRETLAVRLNQFDTKVQQQLWDSINREFNPEWLERQSQ